MGTQRQSLVRTAHNHALQCITLSVREDNYSLPKYTFHLANAKAGLPAVIFDQVCGLSKIFQQQCLEGPDRTTKTTVRIQTHLHMRKALLHLQAMPQQHRELQSVARAQTGIVGLQRSMSSHNGSGRISSVENGSTFSVYTDSAFLQSRPRESSPNFAVQARIFIS